MGQRRKPGVTREGAADQEMRNQEVLRANKELAAYFKGRRTEREARAALKIIKAFVRDRERRGTEDRLPLPGFEVAKALKEATNRKVTHDKGERHRRKPHRTPHEKSSKSVEASIEPRVHLQPSDGSEPAERERTRE